MYQHSCNWFYIQVTCKNKFWPSLGSFSKCNYCGVSGVTAMTHGGLIFTHTPGKWAMWRHSHTLPTSFIPQTLLLSCSLTQPHYSSLPLKTSGNWKLYTVCHVCASSPAPMCVRVWQHSCVSVCLCLCVLFACMAVVVAQWLMYNAEC